MEEVLNLCAPTYFVNCATNIVLIMTSKNPTYILQINGKVILSIKLYIIRIKSTSTKTDI